MKAQVNRLPADAAKGFGGMAIDRARPLTFRLDGRLVAGFAGDTVLSAALASGVDTLGSHLHHPVGLSHRAAPAIALAATPDRALPMARTPAIAGAEFVTRGQSRAGLWQRLFQPGRTLGVGLDQPRSLDRPWRTEIGTSGAVSDVVVVGGGVAGLSSALAAARSGLSVTVIEASPHLGGHSGLFGAQDGEVSAEEGMDRLIDAVRAEAGISILPSTRAFALRQGLVRVHRVGLADGVPGGAVIDLAGKHIVLATGSLERLPIFAGNRLPGIAGCLEAYELARHYGVWPGKSAVIATSANIAYRLATLASDAGIRIERVLDGRPHASSRFIEFSRAYGIIQSPGSAPAWAEPARAGGGLAVGLDGHAGAALIAPRLLTCGGWQPDLTLWHAAGGASRWNGGRNRLEAEGLLDGIALAGSAAGYLTRQGCIQSGADAVDLLLGRKRKPVADPVIDPLYETPDAAPTIAAADTGRAPAYLDGGSGLLRQPVVEPGRWPRLGRRRKAVTLPSLSDAPRPLAIDEVAAGVDLGLVPAEAAGVVAQERVALVPLGHHRTADAEHGAAQVADDHVPPYLLGRFGPGAGLALIAAGTPRRLEAGVLIYRSADAGMPDMAVGVVLRQGRGGAVALLSIEVNQPGRLLYARDLGQTVAVTVSPGPSSGAPPPRGPA